VIIVVAALLTVLSVPLTGKSLAPLAQLRIRRAWAVWTSMLLQLPITLVPGFPSTLGQLVHLLSFVFAGVFVWSNLHLPGEIVMAVGGLMNLTAIVANGGTMPASAWAWRTAGFPPPTESFGNSSVIHSPRLPWLGDVFAVPESWPFSNVFSIGDVAVVAGLAYFVHRTCRTPAVPASAAAAGVAATGASVAAAGANHLHTALHAHRGITLAHRPARTRARATSRVGDVVVGRVGGDT